MKDIKDYLHLYWGCDVKIDNGQTAIKSVVTGTTIDLTNNGRWKSKPILRPLSDMTEEEAIEFCVKEGWGKDLSNIVVTDSAIEFTQNKHTQAVSRFTRCRPEMFTWLLTKGFDLFNLINDGLAIDKTKL